MKNIPNLTKGGKVIIGTVVGYTANYLFTRQADNTTGVTAANEQFKSDITAKVDENRAQLKSLQDKVDKLNTKTDNLDTKAENLDRKVTDLSNKTISKFLPDFDNINLSSLKDFYDTLTIYQVGCIFDISICSGIAITLIEILTIKFGNELIKYFDLENKFPKLAIFLKIRAKLQRYVLIFNVFLIFAFCFLGISVNIYMFFL